MHKKDSRTTGAETKEMHSGKKKTSNAPLGVLHCARLPSAYWCNWARIIAWNAKPKSVSQKRWICKHHKVGSWWEVLLFQGACRGCCHSSLVHQLKLAIQVRAWRRLLPLLLFWVFNYGHSVILLAAPCPVVWCSYLFTEGAPRGMMGGVHAA